jgi:hypothetical protein
MLVGVEHSGCGEGGAGGGGGSGGGGGTGSSLSIRRICVGRSAADW